MTWLKIDDGVRTHPKIVKAGPAAAWQWFCGNCYCRQHLTDGFIPAGMLASLVPGVNEREARKLALVLVNANLWHTADGGYQVHDFLDWNPSKAEVLAKRAEDTNRKKLGKQTDSVEIPAGRITDSKPTRDGRADLSSSLQGSGSSSSEGGSGETAAHPLISGESNPRTWGKIHGEHVAGFCDWVCLPEFIFAQFVRSSAGSEYVMGWARAVRGRFEGQNIGDNLKFWRARWDESHPEKAEKPKPEPFSIEKALAREAARKAGIR